MLDEDQQIDERCIMIGALFIWLLSCPVPFFYSHSYALHTIHLSDTFRPANVAPYSKYYEDKSKPTDTFETFLKNADETLYRAKSVDRNRCIVGE